MRDGLRFILGVTTYFSIPRSTQFQVRPLMEPLAPYFDLAKQDCDPSNGHSLNESMLNVSSACARVGEMAALLKRELTQAEAIERGHAREGDPDASEAKIAAHIKYSTIEEQSAFNMAEACHKALLGKFKALQSALSFLKSEHRL